MTGSVDDVATGERLAGLLRQLVSVPSVSRNEARLASEIEGMLAGCTAAGGILVERVGDCVIARAGVSPGCQGRAGIIAAAHLDTVPPRKDGVAASITGDEAGSGTGGEPSGAGETWIGGLGAVDTKASVAVLLDLLMYPPDPSVGLTCIFYPCEEVTREENGLRRLVASRPDIFEADAAVVGEPTGGLVEAGCQGTMLARIRIAGASAHTARPWRGVNAVHLLGSLLERVLEFPGREVRMAGCTYYEQLQAVHVDGGGVTNVVPDRASCVLNYRFAPDRDAAVAVEALESFIFGGTGRAGVPALDWVDRASFELIEVASGAPPSLDNPFLAALVSLVGAPPKGKLGWTDAATFFEAGIPACNFGPGDPELAHTPHERVSVSELVKARNALAALLGSAVSSTAGTS